MVARVEYDWLGRRMSLSSPGAGLVKFAYDAAGNLIQKQDSTDAPGTRSRNGG
jgi:YD repeat-containing protein